VGSVGDEPALRGECAFQPGQQPVDSVAEFLELISRTGHGQPLVQADRVLSNW
jgi:hypothetical protein